MAYVLERMEGKGVLQLPLEDGESGCTGSDQ